MNLAAPSTPRGQRRQCEYCPARDRSPCGGLRSLESLQRLDAAHNIARRIKSGAAVIGEGALSASTYTILSGCVALTETLADGRTVILHFALPGDVVPLESLGQRSTRSVVAVSESTVCSFSHARHLRLLKEDAQYAARYQAAVARDLCMAYEHFADALLATAAERIVKLLWELAVRTLRYRPTPRDRVAIPLTQIQIGLATGLTAVHVSRTLRQLREQGLLKLSGHTLQILDPPAAEQIAGVSGETLAAWA